MKRNADGKTNNFWERRCPREDTTDPSEKALSDTEVERRALERLPNRDESIVTSFGHGMYDTLWAAPLGLPTYSEKNFKEKIDAEKQVLREDLEKYKVDKKSAEARASVSAKKKEKNVDIPEEMEEANRAKKADALAASEQFAVDRLVSAGDDEAQKQYEKLQEEREAELGSVYGTYSHLAPCCFKIYSSVRTREKQNSKIEIAFC